MIKIKSLKLSNLEDAIYGMRLPLMSHHKSDSGWENGEYIVGVNDLDLMKRLFKLSSDHRKYVRQIFVSMRIVAPQYWFREMDTYKVSTTRNSSSQMHKVMSRRITIDDFSLEDIETEKEYLVLTQYINIINELIDFYKVCEPKDKEKTFRKVIQMLPQSFNYESVWSGSLENLINIYKSRKNHKLLEWRLFCEELEKNELFKKIVLED